MRHEVRFSGLAARGSSSRQSSSGRAAVMYDNKFAVQTQVYGPEARGGASMSAVIIDDDPYPLPQGCDPGYLRHHVAGRVREVWGGCGRGKRSCWSIPRSSILPAEVPVHRDPGNPGSQTDLGRDIVANIVMLGALVAATHVVSEEGAGKSDPRLRAQGTEDSTRKPCSSACSWEGNHEVTRIRGKERNERGRDPRPGRIPDQIG
jgi:2-oxoglutarate ferredoxin oxidoreductase subunit gamma